jgi:hypothetical protein
MEAAPGMESTDTFRKTLRNCACNQRATTTATQLDTGRQKARNRFSRINWLALADTFRHSTNRVRFPSVLNAANRTSP